MLTCRQVTRALADDDYMKLPRLKRILLRIHVGMCMICGRHSKLMIWFYDGFRQYREREEVLLEKLPGLTLEQRDRLKESLHRAMGPDYPAG